MKSIVTLAEVKGFLRQDRNFLRGLVAEVLQETLEAEKNESLCAGKGGTTASRRGYRNGYYARTLITRVGKLELRVPQDRQECFSPEAFEHYQWLERTRNGGQ